MRSKDAQKQLARTSLMGSTVVHFLTNQLIDARLGHFSYTLVKNDKCLVQNISDMHGGNEWFLHHNGRALYAVFNNIKFP